MLQYRFSYLDYISTNTTKIDFINKVKLINLNLRYSPRFLIFYYWNKSIYNTASKNWQPIRKNHNSRRFVYLQELLYIHTDHMHRPNKSPAFLSQNVSPLHSRRIPPNHSYQLLFHQSVLRQVQPLIENHLEKKLYGSITKRTYLVQKGSHHIYHASTIPHGTFETKSSFHVKERTTLKV